MRACDNARRTGRGCFSGTHAAVANGDRGVVIIVGRKLERGTSHLNVKLGQAVTPEPFSVSRDSTLIGATRAVERREDTIAFGEVEELVLEGIPTDRLEWRLQRLRESATVLITVSGVVTSECCVAVELALRTVKNQAHDAVEERCLAVGALGPCSRKERAQFDR